MIKRIFCLILTIALLGSLSLPAFAQEEEEQTGWRSVKIQSAQQFLTFAEKCRLDSYSQNLMVTLETDLDLREMAFSPIPIFCGIFQGQGHSITLELTGEGSYQGLFRYLGKTAQVQDLKLLGNIAPGGSAQGVGALAGQNRGLIKNCSFEGTLSGSSRVGGLVGENAIGGILEGCQVRGSVQGSHFVGGIVGENKGTIRSCTSHAQVNTTSQENMVSLTEIDPRSLLDAESASTVTDIGGIAGISMGVIRSCVNRGPVGYSHMGYNIGGIAGTNSGYLTDCSNYGQIQGRKEVGGIAGQMEPAAVIDFDTDALQILRSQLSGMGSLVNQTAANVQDTGDALSGQVSAMGTYVEDASEAVNLLLPELEEKELIPPAQEDVEDAVAILGGSISGMAGILSGMSATTMSAVGTLSNNLHAMQSQMNAMAVTIDHATEALGGSIRDMSDLDAEGDITGKVFRCRNMGAVTADLNAGGIAGSMALENDLDPEEDWNITGSSSLNFESQLRVVIDGCENTAPVTAGKGLAGGIAGWQSLGLIKNSRNTGDLLCEGAQYVGGIAGQSLGYLRSCAVKCTLTGGRYLGGIAGTGAVVTDCVAMADLEGAGENRGAILGGTEEDRTETEDPTGGNHYLHLSRDEGGIDGVSYEGIAQPMEKEAFFRDSRVPKDFLTAKVTFRFADGRVDGFEIPAGEKLKESQIPALPALSDGQNRWEGLKEADLDQVFFDLTFQETHHNFRTVMESLTLAENGRPLLLAQGLFPDSAVLEAKESALIPPLGEGEQLLGAWVVEMTHEDDTTALHLRLPEDCDRERLVLQLHTGTGWQAGTFTADGSYLVFPMTEGLDGLALIETPAYPWQYPAIIGGALLAAALAFFLVRRKKKA